MAEALPIPASLNGVKMVFIDTEFTGEHAATTLVSIGIVGLDGRELYQAYNDYDESQVTEWLRENVLSLINPGDTRSAPQAFSEFKAFLDDYAGADRLYVVSAGLAQDLVLFLELFKHGRDGAGQFHSLHDLPDYLSHFAFIDLNTLFRTAGVSPPADREAFAGWEKDGAKRHDALHDARVVRDCFLKLAQSAAGKTLIESLER